MTSISSRRLVRLYPRQWRQRYGDEFALLLEATPWSLALVANVVWGAARQQLRTRTGRLVLSPIIAFAAWLTAQMLADAYPPPSSSRAFELIEAALGMAVLCRLALGLLRELPVNGAEFVGWVVVLYAGSVLDQWGKLGNPVTAELWSPVGLWFHSAMSTNVRLILLTIGMPPSHMTSSPYRGSSGPLGLSR